MTRPAVARATLAAVALAAAPEAQAQSWKDMVSSRQITGEEELRVDLGYGAGALTLRRGAPRVLYRVAYRYDDETTAPVAEYRRGRLRLAVSGQEDRRRTRMHFGDGSTENSLHLELAPDLPLELDLDFGAGRADIDLTGLAVRKLQLNTGASESTLRIDEANRERMESASFNVGVADFRIYGVGNLNAEEVVVKAGLGSVSLDLDGEWPVDARMTLEMGLGALKIRAPESLGVQLRNRNTFLASVKIDGLTERGDGWRSPNWDDAPRKVEIDISAALGSIEVVRVP